MIADIARRHYVPIIISSITVLVLSPPLRLRFTVVCLFVLSFSGIMDECDCEILGV